MTAADYEPGVIELVAELVELPPEDLDPTVPFADAGVDSLVAMEIIVHLEAQYAVRFEDTDAKQARTIRDLAALVAGRRAAQEAAGGG